MNWSDTKKRYGLACFINAEPPNPDEEGDDSEFLDCIEDARTRAKTLLRGGRFRYLVLWDAISGEWKKVQDFR